MRKDLLVLSDEDLAALSNRGHVKRAHREVDSGDLPVDLEEVDGRLCARWSDGVEVTIPAQGALTESLCTCPATTLCRHVIRTVLYYQATRQYQAPSTGWDPGAISDAVLVETFGEVRLKKARQSFRKGLLLELVRGVKPVAYFHGYGITVRFLVEGDPRHVILDGGGTLADRAVAAAVWAFRKLPAAQASGYVYSGDVPVEVSKSLIDQLHGLLQELLADGVAGCSPHFPADLHGLEKQLRRSAWLWPAEHLHDIHLQMERYREHDNLFEPANLVSLIGHANLRCQALLHDTGMVPAALILGTHENRTSELKSARLVGLGSMVQRHRRHIVIQAYVQNIHAGSVLVIERKYPFSDDGEQPDYNRLGSIVVFKGHSLAKIAAGQILLACGKCTAQASLKPGRQASVNPQNFQWESLGESLRVDDFQELAERLAATPPAFLRPVNAAENFFVLRVHAVSDVAFDAAGQTLTAWLQDQNDGAIRLQHVYVESASAGFEALSHLLETNPEGIRFVSGHVQVSAGGLVLAPAAVVWEKNGERGMLQPWLHGEAVRSEAAPDSPHRQEPSQWDDPLLLWLNECEATLAETVVVGMRSADTVLAARWRRLMENASSIGVVHMLEPVRAVSEVLEKKFHDRNWQALDASERLLQMIAWFCVAVEARQRVG